MINKLLAIIFTIIDLKDMKGDDNNGKKME